MSFSKFDPHRPQPPEPGARFGISGASSDTAARRAWILKWAWWITMAWTAVGVAFIVYWYLTGKAS